MNESRREHRRFDVRLSAEIQRADGVFTAITRNLSVGGAALEPERTLVEGEMLRLSLFLVYEGVEDERTPPLVVSARVVWVGEGDDASQTAGGRFEGLTAPQSEWLARFLTATEE
jgi:hypothetical protein